MNHNKTLRIEIGCHQKLAVSYLRPETGVFLLKAPLKLWSLHLYASPSNPHTQRPPGRDCVFGWVQTQAQLSLMVRGLPPRHKGDLSLPKTLIENGVAYFHSSGEVGNWETTGYCPSEIQHDSVHFRYLPVLAPLSSGNRWRGGFFEQSLKTMSITLVTHFTLGPHVRNYCVLPLRVHLQLWLLQFYASAFQSTHPSHLIITPPPILLQWR